MQPKILVLGAGGNVGAQVVSSLLNQRFPARAGDLFPERLRQQFGPVVEAVRFDFMQPETIGPALDGIQSVFLMRPPQITDVQKWVFPAVDAARAAGVRHIVFLSLIGIEQNTRVPHYAVEQYLKSSGMSWTFLRCSFFMQNLNTVHRAEIRDRSELYVPVGRSRTSFIDTRDIGAVAALALTQPGHENQAYDLTGAEALDYYQVAEIFSQELGRQVTYQNPSGLQFLLRQLRQKQSLSFALVTTWLYGSTRQGMAERVTGEVRRLLGRSPLTLRQYVKDYRGCWLPETDR